MAEQKGRTKMGEEKAGGAARGKAQHTPGPWFYHQAHGPKESPWLIHSAGRNTTVVVAEVHGPHCAEADARLIAAAPALADALEAVYSDMLDRYDSEPDPPSLVRQVRAALRAAGRLASNASAPKEPPEPTPDPEARRG